jgi:hypothetical protein
MITRAYSRWRLLAFAILVPMIFAACEGPVGPAGPTGPAGPAGPTGSRRRHGRTRTSRPSRSCRTRNQAYPRRDAGRGRLWCRTAAGGSGND